ncbi:MAG: hypothetical protein BMS9Abin05_2263 [Rhodothermia bacterium]|nr:MAG: hypothetical protein BMS9Abin05_2263 [Rhodothermia bacterium]
MTLENDILAFWDGRAQLGSIGGTNDFVLTMIEHDFLLATVPRGSRVLDIGCGNGASLVRLVKGNDCFGIGIDYSARMVEKADEALQEAGIEETAEVYQREIPPISSEWGTFDVAYSQRCLINLTSVEEQREAVLSVKDVLEPGGLYIMLECSLDGGERTNAVRRTLGLGTIDPPWHNIFLKEAEVASWSCEDFFIEDLLHISSTYHFLSRIVYAKLAADRGEELRYDSEINLLATKLPAMIGEFGPVKAWLWRRRG